MERLQGRKAVITGAARGIGRAIALAFASEGCSIALCDLDEVGLTETAVMARQLGIQVETMRVNVTDREMVSKFFQMAEEKMGLPDLLVNNAGIFYNTPFIDMTDEQWHKMMDVNLTSMVIVSQQMLRHWISAGLNGGVIVNMASMVVNMAFTNSSHYMVSKTGVSGLTRALAFEFAPQGVRVNAIAPGIIETEMCRPALTDPNTYNDWMRHIPLKRLGQPEDIAKTAVFLASSDAGYITGQTIIVDGGWLLE